MKISDANLFNLLAQAEELFEDARTAVTACTGEGGTIADGRSEASELRRAMLATGLARKALRRITLTRAGVPVSPEEVEDEATTHTLSQADHAPDAQANASAAVDGELNSAMGVIAASILGNLNVPPLIAPRDDFEKACIKYCARLTEGYVARWGPTHSVAFTVDPRGKKYARITQWSGSQQRNVHCFIVTPKGASDKFPVGTILKAASWKAPALNFGRGNVFKLPKLAKGKESAILNWAR
jgi:hypothetical protein